MKVDPTRTFRAEGLKRAEKPKGAGGTSFAKALDGAMGGSEQSGAVSGVAPVDGLLALQGVDERGGGGRGRQRAESLLDKLEEIRDGLLFGKISTQRLMDLKRMVESRREAVADPNLSGILDEIELRVRVELAKLGVDG